MNSSTTIVNIHGLSEVLCCSVATIQKTWREYPYFFIGEGKTAKSARFIVNDVISYLINRDYKNGISRSENKKMDRRFKDIRFFTKKEKGFQDQTRSQEMGEYQERRSSEPGTKSSPIEDFKSLFNLS
jgi:hypothetical protein